MEVKYGKNKFTNCSTDSIYNYIQNQKDNPVQGFV